MSVIARGVCERAVPACGGDAGAAMLRARCRPRRVAWMLPWGAGQKEPGVMLERGRER